MPQEVHEYGLTLGTVDESHPVDALGSGGWTQRVPRLDTAELRTYCRGHASPVLADIKSLYDRDKPRLYRPAFRSALGSPFLPTLTLLRHAMKILH
jgi:hypothetical protein